MANIGPIRFLTIHCAATPEGRDVKAGSVRQWGIDRFRQPSYHWVIELDGKVVSLLPTNLRGAHTGGANSGNLGICYIGGMDRAMKAAKDTRTPAQKVSMERLVREQLALRPNLIIRGHRDWPGVRKDCPSFSVSSWLREIGV